jgi:bifunctional DNase/RNase
MQEMVIYGVSFDLGSKQPIVLLKTADGNRFLPIWIGHPEAAAILMKLQGASTSSARVGVRSRTLTVIASSRSVTLRIRTE